MTSWLTHQWAGPRRRAQKGACQSKSAIQRGPAPPGRPPPAASSAPSRARPGPLCMTKCSGRARRMSDDPFSRSQGATYSRRFCPHGSHFKVKGEETANVANVANVANAISGTLKRTAFHSQPVMTQCKALSEAGSRDRGGGDG